MLNFILKVFFSLTTTAFASSGSDEPGETANTSVSSPSIVNEVSPAKKDTVSKTQTPIVVFNLINNPIQTTTTPVGQGKSSLKFSELLNKFTLINNSVFDKVKAGKG